MKQLNDLPIVSVVIVSYRIPILLKQALTSLYKYNNSKLFEVIVVDNASNDETTELLLCEFTEVKSILNEVNLGFPAANNQGFSIATGKYIFMLNPDTEFISPLIDNLLTYIEINSNIDLLAPKLLNTDKSHQISTWRFPNVLSVSLDLMHLNSLNGRHFYNDLNPEFQSFEAESMSGAALFFKKECLITTKGLDESMFWIEDVEFCYRLKQLGFKSMYLHELELIHHSGQSAKKNYKISISNQIFNKIKYFRKHGKPLSASYITYLSLVHVITKVLILGILSPFSKIYSLKRDAYVYTLKKVFNPPTGIA
jgi:N-acetylglucosaminyl-diphospho-decaprenol L-rhamnosyltransferase